MSNSSRCLVLLIGILGAQLASTTNSSSPVTSQNGTSAIQPNLTSSSTALNSTSLPTFPNLISLFNNLTSDILTDLNPVNLTSVVNLLNSITDASNFNSFPNLTSLSNTFVSPNLTSNLSNFTNSNILLTNLTTPSKTLQNLTTLPLLPTPLNSLTNPKQNTSTAPNSNSLTPSKNSSTSNTAAAATNTSQSNSSSLLSSDEATTNASFVTDSFLEDESTSIEVEVVEFPPDDLQVNELIPDVSVDQLIPDVSVDGLKSWRHKLPWDPLIKEDSGPLLKVLKDELVHKASSDIQRQPKGLLGLNDLVKLPLIRPVKKYGWIRAGKLYR